MDQYAPHNDLIFYNTPTGAVKIEVIYQEETFWLSQKRMAELFGVDVRTVNEHLQNIYKTMELEKEWTIRKIRIVQQEGNREVAMQLAEAAYTTFRVMQDRNFESDFDKEVKKLSNKKWCHLPAILVADARTCPL